MSSQKISMPPIRALVSGAFFAMTIIHAAFPSSFKWKNEALLNAPWKASRSASEFAGARLALADKVRLMQCVPGSERPAFRITVNIVDPQDKPLMTPVFNSSRQLQVFYGKTLVEKFLIGVTTERYAILLVDVSGSMLELTSDGHTKFEAMISAAERFGGDFDNDIDHVAVIPFASHGVKAGIAAAKFVSQKEDLLARIDNIPIPEHGTNTALFSATKEALARLAHIREKVKAEKKTRSSMFAGGDD